MSDHQFVPDRSVSIVHGPPLSEEPGLGALTLPGFLREVTQAHGDREALVQRRADGALERWSYQDLWARSLEVARALVACGLGKGERVGVLMTNRAEFLSAVFGAALAGGVAAPLSTFSTPDELDYLVGASACSVLLLERRVLKKDFAAILGELEPAIGEAAPGRLASLKFPFLRWIAVVDGEQDGAIEPWDVFLARGAKISVAQVEVRAATVQPADPGVLFFSSGSTSKPKGILSAHRGVSIQLWRMRRQQGLGDGVRAWTANGFFWSGNFAMVVGAVLAAGGALVLQKTFQPEEAVDLMVTERVSFLFAWPHQWAQLEEAANWSAADLSALDYIDIDSPIARHPSVETTWVEPRHCYGSTETFTLSTGYPANTARSTAGDSHGRPFPGNSLKIVDPLTGEATALGQRGEIAIKGPTLMLGYLGTPLDETLDQGGYFRTGDGGYVDAAGRLFWEGRLNDIIKTGGANVSPVEIDSVIGDCPGVKLSQTVGVPHDALGEIVVTCIVRHHGAQLDEAAVRDFARAKLASYKTPRRVLFFAEDDLQLTGSAKVKIADLRKLAAAALERLTS
ncbi:class I adenylate-forming enzyme family protein [Caulobacter soli]|uniref:class I adenylate-forming enzyme family protein n=1 Tax=Caulobacter soli TaxID=2708539 RepID=UPI0013EE36A7|nr:class I adenylate-forming enzyme family protein [Caulobacter soli]